jgi:hypothetical protein
MGWQLIVRGCVAGVVVVAVTALSDRSPRLGAFLLTLPLVSIIAFLSAWYGRGDLLGVSRLARETLVLVPLGLPFFVPLAFAQRLGLGFWAAFLGGLALATITVGLWLWLGPKAL